MSITIKSGAKVLYQWERGVALTASTPCDILRISREDDRVTDDLYPVISGSTGTALIPDRMLTESGYLHVSRIDHADGSERVLETVRILVRHAAKPQNTASSTKEIGDMQTLRMQMAALERAAREGKFDGKDGTTPHIGENGNWWLGGDDTGIAATGDDGITPHIGGNGNWYIGDVDTGVKATGEDGITPHIGENGNWFLGEIDTGVDAKGDDGITPHIGENGNWYIGEEDTGVFARNEDVSLYADDMYTSGILEKGAMPLKILEPSGSNVIRYEIESAVVYIKGVRRARGGFTTSTQSVSFERLFANILRLNEEKGTFSWRVAEVTRDGDSLVNIDNGEIYPARSGGYYDLIPYLVHVPAGATAITYDMVEDLRADERYCGYVRDRLAPAKVSELENDAGYVTEDELASKADGIIDTATGEVLALTDSAEAPLTGLVVYGKSTQDGTPTPDAPVPIVSVGEDGSVDIGVYGANLLDITNISSASAAEVSAVGDVLKITKTGGTTSYANVYYKLFTCSVFAGKTILIAGYYDSAARVSIFCGEVSGDNYKINLTELKKLTGAGYFEVKYELPYEFTGESFCMRLVSTHDSDEKGTEFVFRELSVSVVDNAPYEPYTAQTIPISTPDGLCGIPVTSGGNYTDASGQQWVCDEIDFVRGVRVQRVQKIVTDGSEAWYKETTNVFGLNINDLENPIKVREYGGYMNTKYSPAYSYDDVIKVSNSFAIGSRILCNDPINDLSMLKEALRAKPATIYYVTTEPIETPLTGEELADYRALQTNYPNTTIYADDNAGLSVDYKADTKQYIDKKFDEFEEDGGGSGGGSGGGGVTEITSDMVTDALGYIPVTPQQLQGVNETATAAQTAAAEAKRLAEGASPTDHNQAASTITAGTLAGKVQANASAAATVTTAQVRDIYAGTDDLTAGTSPLASGTLYFVYE